VADTFRSPRGVLQRALSYVMARPAVRRGLQRPLHLLAGRGNYHLVRGMADAGVRPDTERFARAAEWTITTDYVRNGALELICREIVELEVPGHLAELGVFRGDFAWLMSTYLPDRRLHLFDTFEGFDEGDVDIDTGLVDDVIDFSATDADTVRARFARPDLIETHVGYFPATTDGLSDDLRFAVVSIDADLYAPVLAGLRWFYERLSPGGYILVHDYNNGAFAGAKRAVREFQDDAGATVLPLPDWGGTAVITRPLRLGRSAAP
jgi:O-methyltransferase